MELWDIYDIDRNKTDKIMERGAKFNEGDYHLAVHICIFNSKGEMLIQQRQPFKEGWSNMWDITVGGSATKGDTSASAASRELFEEIGYEYDFTGIRPHYTINFDHGFDDYYFIEEDVDISRLKLQYSEVARVKWATRDEIKEMIREGTFIPYYESLLDLFFDSYKNYGFIRR